MYIELTRKVKLILVVLSLSLSICGGVLSFLVLSGYYPRAPGDRVVEFVGPFIPLITYKPLYYSATIAVILGLLPLAIVHTLNSRYIRSMEAITPSFMKSISEAVRSGIPYIKAIEDTARRGFGALGDEISGCLVRIALGEDFEKAMGVLSAKFKSSPIVSRAAAVIAALYGSGGDIVSALDTSAQVLSDIVSFNEEKRTNMKPYLIIMYLAVILITALSFILLEVFINTLIGMIGRAGMLLTPRLSLDMVEAVFYYLAAIEAVLSGLIAGKIYEGRIIGGLIHVVVLLTIVLLSYTIVFPFVGELIKIP